MLLDDELFSVVWFKTYNTDNKKIIEVVPNSWITQNKKKKPFCYYPPKKLWKHVPQWAQDFEDPGSTWSKFSVTLELKNCTYEKGEIFINKEIAKYAVQSAQEDSDSNESDNSDTESLHQNDLDEPIIDATKLMTAIPAYQKIAVSEKSSMKYSEKTKTSDIHKKEYERNDSPAEKNEKKKKTSEEPLSPTPINESDDFSSGKISKMKQVSKRADPKKQNEKEQHRTEQQEKTLSDEQISNWKQACYRSDPRVQNGKDRSKNKSQSDDDSFSGSINQESDAELNYKLLKQDIEILLGKQFTSLKRSLLYDINKRHEELVCMIKIKKGQSSLLVDAREKLNFPSAFDNVEEFIEFDESLENDEKAKLTSELMRVFVGKNVSLSAAIANVMKKFVKKNVQLEYSGKGRAVAGKPSKRNFSATNTYKLMLVILMEDLDAEEAKILSTLSRWLSGAGDREGGAKERKNKKVE